MHDYELTTNRGQNGAHGLDRFNNSHRLALLKGISRLRKLQKYNITQRILSEIGNPNRSDLTLGPDPFVAFGVFEIVRNLHRFSIAIFCCESRIILTPVVETI